MFASCIGLIRLQVANRTNIQHTDNPKVRRTVRLQTGVQPPFIIVTKQSPEGATDRQQGIACHPFRVLFNQYHLCRDLHPCLCSAVPVGDLMGKKFINNHRTTTLSEINIPGCKLQTRPNIQHPCSRKVLRTVRLQTGVQPPLIDTTKQSPEGATDCQQGLVCHPFRVPINHYHCAGVHSPACVLPSPVGDLIGK